MQESGFQSLITERKKENLYNNYKSIFRKYLLVLISAISKHDELCKKQFNLML